MVPTRDTPFPDGHERPCALRSWPDSTRRSAMAVMTTLSSRLGLACPIIVAPMAGGATTVELVAASCEAGALGSLAGAYSTPHQIAEMARAVRAQTTRPFAINLFAPTAPPD